MLNVTLFNSQILCKKKFHKIKAVKYIQNPLNFLKIMQLFAKIYFKSTNYSYSYLLPFSPPTPKKSNIQGKNTNL